MATTEMASRGAADPAARRAQVVDQARAAGLHLVRFLYCDNDGIVRGKAAGTSRLAEWLDSGIGLTLAMQAFTMLDRLAAVEGMGVVGEIRLVPDLDTFVVAPYAPNTGVVMVDMVNLDGRPYEADGRHFLRRMVERAAAIDLEVLAAFEPEWALARREDDRFVPIDDAGCFTTNGMNAAAEVVDDLVAALEEQGLQVEQYYAELGWGQQELSIQPASALRAADNHILYRETVRGMARRHGLWASFAPKPWPAQAGNGCHLHFSGWTLGRTRNRFHNEKRPHGLSDLGAQFMAGVLEHLPALIALTCASVNSYRRLQPQMWASAYRVWGPDNREGGLRLASSYRGREAASTNVELKASDSSANPHLALGAVIAAGLDGIERQIQLPPPVEVDPHTLGEEERKRVGAVRHPETLADAVANLKRDDVILDALGQRLAASYIAVKESDIEAFAGEDEAFEFRQHFYKF